MNLREPCFGRTVRDQFDRPMNRHRVQRIVFSNDDTDVAAAEADKAIALENDALDAMAIHGAIELIANRSPEAWFAKIHAINPHYGEASARVGRQLGLHYRYEDAVTYYRKAVELEPRLWAAHSALGIALMRLGQEDEPFRELELCYDNGYRDKATVNSLRLLDSYKNFETFRDSTTIQSSCSCRAAASCSRWPYRDIRCRSTTRVPGRARLPGPIASERFQARNVPPTTVAQARPLCGST